MNPVFVSDVKTGKKFVYKGTPYLRYESLMADEVADKFSVKSMYPVINLNTGKAKMMRGDLLIGDPNVEKFVEVYKNKFESGENNKAGSKIFAIKEVRKEMGCSLGEAKRIVEQKVIPKYKRNQ